jgi:hypothetical protein
VKLAGKEAGQILHIVLLRSNNPLAEVKVIAYGTTTDRFKVGSIWIGFQ